MTRYGLDDDEDYWQCPECDAVFVWQDYTAFTGSGNNDEQTLQRVAEPHATTVRALRRGTTAVADDELAELAANIAFAHAALVITLLRRDAALVWRLVPHLADHAGALEVLLELVDTADGAARMRTVLGERTASHFAPLWERVRVVGCTICRDIPGYPGLRVSRDALPANVAKLEQCGHSAEQDVWRCRECESLFEWDGKSVRRIPDPFAKCIHECLYAPVVSPAALKMVFDGGRDWVWVRERAAARVRR